MTTAALGFLNAPALRRVRKAENHNPLFALLPAWLAAVDATTQHAPRNGIAVRLMSGLPLREGEVIGACWE